MGYIAPIHNYQYQHYQERGLKTAKVSYTFLPVQPVRIKSKSQDEYDDFQNAKGNTSLQSFQIHHGQDPHQEPHSEIMEELTGKGKYINEYI